MVEASFLIKELHIYEDFSAFKLFVLDVGLLGAMTKLEPETILDGNKIFEEFKGAIVKLLAISTPYVLSIKASIFICKNVRILNAITKEACIISLLPLSNFWY